MCTIEGGTALSMPPSSNQLRDFVPLSRRCHRRRFSWSELRKESCLRDKRCGRSSSRPVEASILSAADHKIVCDFEVGLYVTRIAGSSENGDAPFPAGREAVRMFLRA